MGLGTVRDRLLLLDGLNQIYARLESLVLAARPESDEDRAALTRLVDERDALADQIDKLLHQGMRDVAGAFDGPRQSLVQVSRDLSKVSDDIEGVKAAVALAGKVIEVTAKLVAALA